MKTLTKQFGLPVFVLFLSALTLLGACKKEEGDNNAVTAETARIIGVVTTPSGTPVGAATIKAGNFTTKSDRNGAFNLQLLSGNHRIIIYTGSGNVFRTEFDLTVAPKAVINLPQSMTILKQTRQIAYFAGVYDNIQTIIIDSLGYTAVPGQINNLTNPSYHQNFGGLFFNCGVLNSVSLDSTIYAGLSDYVNNHGSIYVSDFAVELITGDGNYRLAAPGKQHLHKASAHHDIGSTPNTFGVCATPDIGGFLPDSSLCTSKSGATMTIYNADILDQDIILALGKDSIDILYNLGGWERISLIDSPFTTIIEDNNQGQGPLAASCDLNGSNTGGKIFFTTFHNHPQGTIGPDVKLILQYFILNL